MLFSIQKKLAFQKKMKYLGIVIRYTSSPPLPSPPKVMLPRFSEISAILSGMFHGVMFLLSLSSLRLGCRFSYSFCPYPLGNLGSHGSLGRLWSLGSSRSQFSPRSPGSPCSSLHAPQAIQSPQAPLYHRLQRLPCLTGSRQGSVESLGSQRNLGSQGSMGIAS